MRHPSIDSALALLFASCSVLGERCEDGAPTHCEGEFVVQCEGGFEALITCASGSCDSSAGACTNARCGDGILVEGEECDDANNSNNDSCNADCSLPSCGDGILSPGESCDDANTAPGDGCSDTCQIEFCGDGVVNQSLGDFAVEQCDDGNVFVGDGCNNLCKRERCGDGILEPGITADTNGDGLIDDQDQAEACDDANLEDGDGCERDCLLPRCGNGLLDLSSLEACDDGSHCSDGSACAQSSDCIGVGDGLCLPRSGDGCSASCQDENLAQNCGNGIVEAGEFCGFEGATEGTPGVILTTGNSPSGMQLADVNLDGRFDIVCVNLIGDSISVFLQNAPRGYLALPPIPTGDRPLDIDIADFNLDALPDFAWTEQTAKTVTVETQAASGVFALEPLDQFATGLIPLDIIAADFDRDGLSDVAFANGDSHSVGVALAQDRIDGLAPFSIDNLGENVTSLVAVDLTQDLFLDLVVVDFNSLPAGNLHTFINDGTGHFTHDQDLFTGVHPQQIVTADFNSDGLVDIATPNFLTEDVSVFLGNPDGSFTGSIAANIQDSLTGLTVADLNRDGDPDLATIPPTKNFFVVLLGDGAGGFSQRLVTLTNFTGNRLLFEDLDRDGALDVVIEGVDQILIYYGKK